MRELLEVRERERRGMRMFSSRRKLRRRPACSQICLFFFFSSKRE